MAMMNIMNNIICVYKREEEEKSNRSGSKVLVKGHRRRRTFKEGP